MMSQIFISFIHEEEEYAAAVKRFIGKVLGKAAEPFLASDKAQIPAGEIWLDRIKEQLRQAQVMVLMLSPRSVKKAWVNFEAGAAWIRELKVIPVCFNGMTKNKLPKPYSSYQGLNLFEAEDQFYLVSSIAAHLGMLPPTAAWHDNWFDTGKNLEFTSARSAYQFLQSDLEVISNVAKMMAIDNEHQRRDKARTLKTPS